MGTAEVRSSFGQTAGLVVADIVDGEKGSWVHPGPVPEPLSCGMGTEWQMREGQDLTSQPPLTSHANNPITSG